MRTEALFVEAAQRSRGYLPPIRRAVTVDAALALATALGVLPARAATTEVDLEDAPTTVYFGDGADIILLNGATPLGRGHPGIVRLATALARIGQRVLVPDVYGIDRGEIGDRGVAATMRVAGATNGPFAFFGVSVVRPSDYLPPSSRPSQSVFRLSPAPPATSTCPT